jgi:hypothetical protein
MNTKFLKIILFLVIVNFDSIAQKPILASDEIKVFGLIENSFNLSFSKILNEKATEIGDFKVTNHLGEFRKEYKNLKGVQLINLLSELKIKSPSPKELSEFYLIFRGSDGYSVVFSWNEIFNNESGQFIFIVTEADGKSLAEGSERILLISTKDYKTGRRHIKGLTSIEIKRI